MERVTTALNAGKLSLAIGGALLRDAEVMLALRERAALTPMALSGVPVAPCGKVTDSGIARSVAEPGGVLVLVEPELADQSGLKELGTLLSRVKNKPQVLVVSRSFNPLTLALVMPGIAAAHLKGRGKKFLQSLVIPADMAAAPVAKVEKVAKAGRGNDKAPRFHFVGREEEVPALVEILGAPGPIVVSGPEGIGRTWLIEHALAETSLTRLPDLRLFRGSGFDTFVARLAKITSENGATQLADALAAEDRTPLTIIAAAIEALKASSTDNHVMVVRGLDAHAGREADFFRKSRVEMLLMALLTNTYPLRLVFLSGRQPTFYREGAAQTLRRFEVGGLKGREYYDIFQAYKAPEFARDKIGPLTEKIHGHPLAIRTYAISVRDGSVDLLENAKFLKAEKVSDLGALRRTLGKRLEKLAPAAREALAKIGHFPYPLTGAEISELGIGRNGRLELLSLGLIDMTGTEKDRKYQINGVVRGLMSRRELADFQLLNKLSERYYKQQRDAADPVARLALQQEANRTAVEARNARNHRDLPYPDHDALVESCYGLMRGKTPRFKMAQQRLRELLKKDPSNADAHIAYLELLSRMEEKPSAIDEACDEAIAKAPVPEVFHQAVGYALGRRARNKGIAILEKGVAAIPDDSRLRTRLASLLMRQGRRPEAIEHLKNAMERDPMLPDAYGILGMARRDEGIDKIEEAESLLREAVRLAPQDPVQVSRLVGLQMDRARIADAETAKTIREEARQLMDEVIKADRDQSQEILMMMGMLLREEGTDLERAGWFLKKARKLTKRRERDSRLRLEEAQLEVARGNLDAAENAIRKIASKEPSNPRVFMALSSVLAARQLYIPAHAELLRAKERVNENSLQARDLEQRMLQLQALIEAQAAGLLQQSQPEAAPSLPDLGPSEPRFIRRPGGANRDQASASEEAALAEAPESAEVAASAEAPDPAAPAEAPESAEVATPAEAPESVEAAAPAEAPESAAPAEAPEPAESAETAAPSEVADADVDVDVPLAGAPVDAPPANQG